MRAMTRKLAKLLRGAGLAILALAVLYAVAGLLGGAVAANASRSPPTTGVVIYVENNGVHTGLVLPVRAAGVDWSGAAAPDDLRDRGQAGHRWRAFGWGDRDFYLNTPRWRDTDPAIVVRAAMGTGHTVVHVEAIGEPPVGKDVRRVVLRPEEYRRLARFVMGSFGPGVARHGYDDNDAFYPGTGRYNAIKTCNAWTGAGLRTAGVRMGRWTPFPVTVMWWL